ncbi:hypothetical protein NQZ68_017579 [Dissostichus eleginoides]|nr:hypothetical protein NQZ68_017579 [Dissostichus eleginoides]
MQRRRPINPKEDAKFYIDTRGDKAGLDVQYINAIKGIFKGDFLIEYRGELISKQECERRLKLYPVRLKIVTDSDCTETTESYTKTTVV